MIWLCQPGYIFAEIQLIIFQKNSFIINSIFDENFFYLKILNKNIIKIKEEILYKKTLTYLRKENLIFEEISIDNEINTNINKYSYIIKINFNKLLNKLSKIYLESKTDKILIEYGILQEINFKTHKIFSNFLWAV